MAKKSKRSRRSAGSMRGRRSLGRHFEGLEERVLLSCTAGINNVLGVQRLAVVGSSGADNIELHLKTGDPSTLEVDCDTALVGSFLIADIAGIRVTGKGDADVILINESNGTFTDSLPTTLIGDGGDDTITGGSGGEEISGGNDDDSIAGGGGADTIAGGRGKDTIDGGDGADSISGGADDDALAGGDGDDTVDGGTGNDLIAGDGVLLPALPADVPVDHYNMLNGQSGTFTYHDESYNGNGNNAANLSPLDSGLGDLTDGFIPTDCWNHPNTEQNPDGPYVGWVDINPTITVVFDEIHAFDTATFSFDDVGCGGGVNAPTAVIVNGTNFPIVDPPGSAPFSVTVDISDQTTDTLVVQPIRNGWVMFSEMTFQQIPQAEVSIGGGTGNDSVIGGDGDDTIFGGAGDDDVSGGIGNDMVNGGAGSDTVDGGDGNDVYGEAPGSSDVLIDSGGRDTLDFSGATAGITLDMAIDNGTAQTVDGSNTIALNGRFENLIGSAFDDSIGGNATGNVINLGEGNDSVDGAGDKDTIDGGDGNDSIFGGVGSDVIMTGDGDNTVDGGAGFDAITGGAGNDSIFGGGDNDTIAGGAGDDNIDGGAGDDLLFEDADVNLTLTDASMAGLGSDTLASVERASLVGGQSANSFDASGFSGRTTLIGNAANDTLTGGSNIDWIEGNDGNDSVSGGAGNDTILGGLNNDTLVGDAGDDNLDGGLGLDSLSAGTGNDRLIGGPGGANVDDADTMLGGPGDDRYIILNNNASFEIDRVGEFAGEGLHDILDFSDVSGNRVVIDYTVTGINQDIAAKGVFKIRPTVADLAQFFEDAIGTTFVTNGDVFTGNASNNTWQGLDGNDTFTGGAGTDRVIEKSDANFILTDTSLQGRGNDSLSSVEEAELTGGVSGNTLNASSFTGSVTLSGAGGGDLLQGGSGNDLLDGGTGNDTVDGGAGTDRWTSRGTSANEFFDIDWDGVDAQVELNRRFSSGGAIEEADTGELVEELVVLLRGGNDRGDASLLDSADLTAAGLNLIRLDGGGGADTLLGSAGPDQLWGTGGNDSLSGGLGNDSLKGDAGSDTLDGGGGTDQMVSKMTGANEWYDIDWDGVGSQLVANRRLSSSGAPVETDNATGIEALWVLGYAGADNIDASMLDSADLAASGITAMTLQGGAGNDVLIGSAGNDLLLGKVGNDDLSGGPGDDTLDGEAGTDTLDGGADNDTCLGGESESNCESASLSIVIEPSDAELAANFVTLGGARDDELVAQTVPETETASTGEFNANAPSAELERPSMGQQPSYAELVDDLFFELGGGAANELTGLSTLLGESV